MANFRLEVRANWRSNGKSDTLEGVPLVAVMSGATAKGYSSNEAQTIADIIRLFDMADGAQALFVVLKWFYAHKMFPTDRSLDFFSIGVHDMKTDKMVVTATGKDLKVAHSAPGENGDGNVVLDLHSSQDGISATKV